MTKRFMLLLFLAFQLNGAENIAPNKHTVECIGLKAKAEAQNNLVTRLIKKWDRLDEKFHFAVSACLGVGLGLNKQKQHESKYWIAITAHILSVISRGIHCDECEREVRLRAYSRLGLFLLSGLIAHGINS